MSAQPVHGGSDPGDPEFEQSAREARDARPEDLAPLPGWTDWR